MSFSTVMLAQKRLADIRPVDLPRRQPYHPSPLDWRGCLTRSPSSTTGRWPFLHCRRIGRSSCCRRGLRFDLGPCASLAPWSCLPTLGCRSGQ
jgi:hypothetical protein